MSEVLQGKTRDGDIIHQTLVMGDENGGFNKVARYCLKNGTMPFEDALSKLDAEVAEREDITGKLKQTGIAIGPAGKIVLHINGTMYTPTHHALLQLANWLDTPQTMVNWFLNDKLKQNKDVKFSRDRHDAEIVVDAFLNGMRRVDSTKEMLFRTYKDGTLRAVLSDRYAIIDNRWYLEQLKDLIPGVRVSHWRGNADTIFGNVLIPDTIRVENDSEYGGMLSVGNCEIGLRLLFQYPSVFRAICMNGCIWDQEKGSIYKKVHRGEIDLVDLRAGIRENINKQIPLLDAGVTRFLGLRSREIPKTDSLSFVFACLGKENQFTNAQIVQTATEWADAEKNDRNAFGVINAITRAGQKYDPDTWFKFDVLAGKFMNMTENEWAGFLSRARGMDPETVRKIYGGDK